MLELQWTITALYFTTLAILACYGMHRLVLLVLLYRPSRVQPPPTPAAALSDWPVVTVQLPIFNEINVAPRLIASAAALEYPHGQLEIQVLDDSTDETVDVVAALIDRLRGQGHDIHHIRRDRRSGYKAGALEAGLERARGEMIAVLDADFVPPHDFLREVVPHFTDPKVGMVQARWGHLNGCASVLTRVQALLLDGHFLIEHAARERAGRFFNFNGTAGVWRRRCIESSGGWQHDTLTEDLDLSYRAQLAGWQFRFLPHVIAPAELPADITALLGQQHRWAKGSVQTARKLLPRILTSPIPLSVRAEATIHLTSNAAHALMVPLAVLFFPAALLRSAERGPGALAADLALLAASMAAYWVFYIAAGVKGGAGAWRAARTMPALMMIGVGLSVNSARAALGGLFGQPGTFERTPKHGQVDPIHRSGAAGHTEKLYRSRKGAFPQVEAALAIYLAVCLILALGWGLWWFVPFLVLFWAGYTHMTVATFLEAKRNRRLFAR